MYKSHFIFVCGCVHVRDYFSLERYMYPKISFKKYVCENWKYHQTLFILYDTNNLYPIPLGDPSTRLSEQYAIVSRMRVFSSFPAHVHCIPQEPLLEVWSHHSKLFCMFFDPTFQPLVVEIFTAIVTSQEPTAKVDKDLITRHDFVSNDSTSK